MSVYQDNLPSRSILEKYAEVIVRHGLNVQQGQTVLLSAEVIHSELAITLASMCYDHGAKYVSVEFSDPRVSKKRLQSVPEDTLSYLPKWISQQYSELVDEESACIRLLGSEFPDILSDLPRNGSTRLEWLDIKRRKTSTRGESIAL